MNNSQRNSYCFKLVDGKLEAVPDPTDSGDGDVDANIRKAGYHSQISSRTDERIGAEIIVYSTEDKEKPKFYIDITGSDNGLGAVVADDFPALLATLKELAGIISLISLDQQTNIQAEAIMARHPVP